MTACLALALVLGSVGCSGQTEEASKLVSEANGLAEKYNDLEAGYLATWNELWGSWHGVGTPALEGPEAKLAEMDTTAEDVIELMDRISELDVSEEFTTYAGMVKHLWQLRIEKSDALRDGFALLKRYPVAESEDERRELLNGYEINMAEVVIPLNAQIVKERDAAQRYYEENGLGE